MLTKREQELVRLYAYEGLSGKDAAYRMGVTHMSFRTYVHRLARKLDLSSGNRWSFVVWLREHPEALA